MEYVIKTCCSWRFRSGFGGEGHIWKTCFAITNHGRTIHQTSAQYIALKNDISSYIMLITWVCFGFDLWEGKMTTTLNEVANTDTWMCFVWKLTQTSPNTLLLLKTETLMCEVALNTSDIKLQLCRAYRVVWLLGLGYSGKGLKQGKNKTKQQSHYIL